MKKKNKHENITENDIHEDNIPEQTEGDNTETVIDKDKYLKDITAECEEWKQKYLYTLAELDNFRKRSAKEKSELIRYGSREVFYDLLDIIDNFSRAIEADKKESDPKVIVQGIEMIYNQLLKLLQNNDVTPIVTADSEFDPNFHDAMQKLPTSEHKPGTIVQEILKGYKYRDKILRPARVIVASESEPEQEQE